MAIDKPELLIKKMKSDFDKFFKNKAMWQEVGDEAVVQIKATVRLGKGVTDQFGQAEKFEPLAASTKRHRSKANLASFTKPNKSNLTETGKMMDDLSSSAKDDSVTISFKNKNSAQIASYHNEGGPSLPKRAFMNFSKNQFNLLLRTINKFVAKKLKEN